VVRRGQVAERISYNCRSKSWEKIAEVRSALSSTGDVRNAIEEVVFILADRLRDAALGTENRG
jgi:hypothetical protein